MRRYIIVVVIVLVLMLAACAAENDPATLAAQAINEYISGGKMFDEVHARLDVLHQKARQMMYASTELEGQVKYGNAMRRITTVMIELERLNDGRGSIQELITARDALLQ